MKVSEQALDCVFTFPDQTSHPAQANRIECECGSYSFWFGVAYFTNIVLEMPTGIISGRCRFDDGRAGLVSIQTATRRGEQFFEFSFIGISELV